MLIIWHDDDFDLGIWVFKNINFPEGENVLLRPLPKNNNPSTILEKINSKTEFEILPLIKYETPDLIIQETNDGNSRIVSVTELMTHTPQWQHPAQRFARIYSASELGVPTSFILPRNKVKLEKGSGDFYSEGTYTCSKSVYALFAKANQFSEAAVLPFHWPDKDGYLKTDREHPTAPMIIDNIVDWLSFVEECYQNQTNDSEIVRDRLLVVEENKNEPDIEDYGTIEGLINTKKFINQNNLDEEKLSKKFLRNENTLVFAPSGLAPPSSYFRTDPYAGMLCAYDYLFCRNEEGQRKINLVFKAKDIEFAKLDDSTFSEVDHDESTCPFLHISNSNMEEMKKHIKDGECPYVKSKQQKIYGGVSDLVIFEDKIYYSGESNS